jgi:threonine dehydratase
VSSASPSYALSFAQKRVVPAPAQTQIADGLACRMPAAAAMEAIWQNVARVVEVGDAEIAAAMRIYYQDTHNIAEGAGAAPLAAAIQEMHQKNQKRIGLVLTGANVDMDLYENVLSGAFDGALAMQTP